MDKKEIHTKFGTARLHHKGHYRITSSKEGNHNKMLHRLIYEDYHKVTLMSWADIHHKDGNKTNNDIDNLELLSHSKHSSLTNSGVNHPMYGLKGKYNPNYGRKASDETKKKLSDAWTDERRKQHIEKFKGKSLSEEHKKKLSEAHIGTNHDEDTKLKLRMFNSIKKNTTGYLFVSREKDGRFRYNYYENGKRKRISAASINKLKEKVIARNLDWIKLDQVRNNNEICKSH